MTELIIKAYDILDELKADKLYSDLKKAKQSIESAHKTEILAFNHAKIKYDEIMQTGGSYHPDYKAALMTLSATKKTLYEVTEVNLYIMMEKAFETKINTLLKTITSSISNHIQTPDELGLFKKQGGGCGVH